MFEIIGKLVGNILGSETKSGESQLLELFKGNKQKERDFKLLLESEYQKKLNLEIEDLQNARGMQIEALKQKDVFAKRFVYYLAAVLILFACLANILPFMMELPPNSEVLVNRSTDFFNYVVAGGIISFFFGAKIKTNDKNRR